MKHKRKLSQHHRPSLITAVSIPIVTLLLGVLILFSFNFGNRYIVGLIVILMVVIALIPLGYRSNWTGFSEDLRDIDSNKDLRRAKTLWDWLQILLIPIAVAAIGVLFTFEQNRIQRENEKQRAHDAALQGYLDQMSRFLVEGKLGESEPGSSVRKAARARTISLLTMFDESPESDDRGGARTDADRKRQVMAILDETELIEYKQAEDKAIVLLDYAHFQNSDLRQMSLQNSHLSRVYLSNSYLNGTNLSKAILTNADLSGADLSGADLSGADLSGADLSSADLSGADLSGATISQQQLATVQSLKEATMPDR